MWPLALVVFFFKQKTAYEMRISDWSSDVCSSDLQSLIDPALDRGPDHRQRQRHAFGQVHGGIEDGGFVFELDVPAAGHGLPLPPQLRVLLLVQHGMAALALGPVEDFPAKRN